MPVSASRRFPLSRRTLLAGGAAAMAVLTLPARSRAADDAIALTAGTRTLDIGGRAATVWGLINGAGGSGLVLEPGQRFRVDLANALPEATLIHWHGQIPPNVQDGVPDLPMPLLQPGATRSYDFAASPGTHWMHAHVPLHELRLLAAPLIVRRPEDVTADRQEVVMFLHDFSFDDPETVLARATGGAGMAPMDHSATSGAGGTAMAGMDMGGTDMGQMDMAQMDMGGMAMDLNDIDFDAYLCNDRTLDDPQVVPVDPGGRVLLRIINGSAATVFGIDTGALAARIVATDGHPVEPLAGTVFPIAMGQRMDIAIDLPRQGGAWPVLALREGGGERTGLVLATAAAHVARISGLAETAAPAFSADLSLETALRAVSPLAARDAATAPVLMLGGSMQPYTWTINGETWANHTPVPGISGARSEITFHNMSMMAHPMHLHGHSFQVVAINGTRIAGALRDTVQVPPMARITVALDGGEAANWMLHCHNMLHLATGMMTEFAVSA